MSDAAAVRAWITEHKSKVSQVLLTGRVILEQMENETRNSARWNRYRGLS